MNEMVERVAKAICKDIDQTEDDWKFMITTAKAAIEAMKEPTEVMTYNVPLYIVHYYRAMIEAALKDA